ncbi:CehA/McbA family metallohydrolase [Spirosoma validum]|uniref:CehA/McbA family metallohydrolase n=1 Tax=Spirosoma validum TaxID=2771355 RepID=A0A927B7M7_9BACT|nr:CehA/McbA family metallohydrolase [Spirosoma validum]MBD2757205.1 CehA/McbA family metallohydrolase [Spirosoma validum]
MNNILRILLLNVLIFFLEVPSKAYAQRTGSIYVGIQDDVTGKPTPVRVRITLAGKPVKTLPNEVVAVSYGLWDHADGYAFQPDSSFYVSGSFRITLPPGVYQFVLSKGNEYISQTHSLRIRPGQTSRQQYRMKRWINMVARNWYSADSHIHIRRSPRENQPLLNWIQAEDINVGVLLKMGDFWETYYPQYAFGEKGIYRQGNYLLTAGQEDPRTPEIGHALGFGATFSMRFGRDYYYYDKVFDELHKRGGLTGYAHQAESFHGYRGLTLDGLRGKVDVLEILQYCVSPQPLRTEHYYHMLDLGFQLTATAGSDFPWCGHDHDHGPPEHSAQIGNARFYTYLNKPFNQASWQASVAAGHTFVSSGPILDFRVNNAIPGDHLNVKKGETLTITAQAYGHPTQVPLQAIEIIAHGRVLKRITKYDPGQSSNHLAATLELKSVEQGMWIAARCYGDSTQAAHTTPIYVTIDGGGFHNSETVDSYLNQSEKYLQELEQELETHRDSPEFRAWYYKKGLKDRVDETRQVISVLRNRLSKR